MTNIINKVQQIFPKSLIRKKSTTINIFTEKEQKDLYQKMQNCIDTNGGEIAARINTVELGNIYLGLSQQNKEIFLLILNQKFDINTEKIQEILKKYQKEPESKELARQLYKTLEPQRNKILKQFNGLDNGIKFLVNMRADTIELCKKYSELINLNNSLYDILSDWFDVGLLNIKQITWDCSAMLLEKLITYEAVHEITSWADLRNRLDSDRRCFAFFHPKIEGEPLIFIEVAFTRGIENNIQNLLDSNQKTTQNADTAIFYSISNTQKGLRNINLGNFLIKKVVSKITAECPSIKVFATLSPIPGFKQWIEQQELLTIQNILGQSEKELLKIISTNNIKKAIHSILNNNWIEDKEICSILQKPMLKLCAYYLIKSKNKKNKALNPVANFHLSNGATIYKINWMADTSEKGMSESCSIMVNYHYNLNKINDNHQQYITNNTIKYEKQIEGLLGNQSNILKIDRKLTK